MSITRVGYVIPLKSKKVSDDWAATSLLLAQTLKSLLNQTDKRFEVVVVCHEKPEIDSSILDQIKLIECDFELVRKNYDGTINHYKQIDYILDKNRKLSTGLKYMSDLNVQYYMVLDADDLVHENLTSYLLNTNNPNGYIVHKGYEYYVKNNRCITRADMDNICGSTAIVHASQIVMPAAITDSSMSAIPWCYLSHSDFKGFYEKANRPLLSVPFESIMYKLGHGENASNEFPLGLKVKLKTGLKILLLGKKPSKELSKAFGLK